MPHTHTLPVGRHVAVILDVHLVRHLGCVGQIRLARRPDQRVLLLPPLLMQVGGAEVLLDDSIRTAERAREAGVDVTFKIWEGMPHVWQVFANFLPEAQQALEECGEFIRKHTADI